MKSVLLLCALVLGASAAKAPAQEAAWTALREPGSHIVMRHAEAPGTGDPAGFRLDDCATQRNLSEDGRAQARRIGRQIENRGVAVDRVLTSQWCRSSETASLLALAPVAEEPALNSFFEDRSTADRQSRAVKERLKALDRTDERALLVTHQVNITALTGVVPASSEMVVVRLNGNDLAVVGRIRAPSG